MTKAKINFEIDEQVLAHAQAFAARRRVSLSKLVTSFFASLGRDGTLGVAPARTQRVLAELSVGKVSLADAAHELGLQDAGFLLQMLRAEGLPLPVLDAGFVQAQADASYDAMRTAMLPGLGKPLRKPASAKRPAAA